MEDSLKINDWKKPNVRKAKEQKRLRFLGLALNIAICVLTILAYIKICESPLNAIKNFSVINLFINLMPLTLGTFSFSRVFKFLHLI